MDLIALGVPFDRTPDGKLAQSLEAAHSRPRVVRVSGDLAGKAIMEALIAAAHAASHIEIVENARADTLLRGRQRRACAACCAHATGARFDADETVLATGGVGGLYAVTTNPPEAMGQGFAMAAARRRADRRSGIRAISSHRHRHRPRSRAARHRSAARRRRAPRSTPRAKRSFQISRRAMLSRARSISNARPGAAPFSMRALPSARNSRIISQRCSPPA